MAPKSKSWKIIPSAIFRESNGTANCVPWYLPNVESNSTMCDPWDALRFVHFMENVPDSECNHCKPDCNVTTYTEVRIFNKNS